MVPGTSSTPPLHKILCCASLCGATGLLPGQYDVTRAYTNLLRLRGGRRVVEGWGGGGAGNHIGGEGRGRRRLRAGALLRTGGMFLLRRRRRYGRWLRLLLRRGRFYHLLSLAHRLGLDLLILTGHLSLVWYLLDMTGVSRKLLRVAHLLDKLLLN